MVVHREPEETQAVPSPAFLGVGIPGILSGEEVFGVVLEVVGQAATAGTQLEDEEARSGAVRGALASRAFHP